MQEQNLKRVLLESAGKKGKSQQLGLIYDLQINFNLQKLYGFQRHWACAPRPSSRCHWVPPSNLVEGWWDVMDDELMEGSKIHEIYYKSTVIHMWTSEDWLYMLIENMDRELHAF